MKRTSFILAAALALTGAVTAAKQTMRDPSTADGDGHVLTAQWDEYRQASRADLPQKMADILSGIKAEALRKHYAEDFYDAGREYVNVVRRRDWKAADAAREAFAEEVARFDEPIVTFIWMNEVDNAPETARLQYVQTQADRLRAGEHRYFYRRLHHMGGNLVDFIRDDYEYALWALLAADRLDAGTEDPVHPVLAAEIGDRYPARGYLDYHMASRLPEDKAVSALDAVARRYEGRAVGLWPRQSLLLMRFDGLVESHASSDQFRSLLSLCEAYEWERAALRGDEKKVAAGCTSIEGLIRELKAERVDLSLSADTVTVTFRNVADAEISLFKADAATREEAAKTVYFREVPNPVRSFYVEDPVSFVLPRLDDGRYTLKAVSGDLVSTTRYEQYTVSVAVRRDKSGYAAYAADYRTGQPVDSADVRLYAGDKEVAVAENFRFDGFTPLPDGMQRLLAEDRNHYLECSYVERVYYRRSRQVSLYSYADGGHRDADGTYCNIYKDRGAYHPGETVRFKAVLYRGDLVEQVRGVGAGMEVEARLYDAEGRLVEKKPLTTNAFGSVAGDFTLPLGLRNGHFSLLVGLPGSDAALGSATLVVDEFVLPTFEVAFDRDDRLHFPGDTVTVTGRLTSYSGHSLTGARLRAVVRLYGTVIAETEVRQAADGTFRIPFPTRDRGWYAVELTVTDETGETQGYATGLYVDSALRVSLTLDNAADGEFDLIGEDGPIVRPIYRRRSYGSVSKGIVCDPEARFRFGLSNANGDPVRLDLVYELRREDGTLVDRGTVPAGEVRSFAIPDSLSGLYRLKASAEARRSDGETVRDEHEYAFVRITERDSVLNAPSDRFFLSGPDAVETGDTLHLRMGCADGPLWAVAELFGKDFERLDTRLVHLGGQRDSTSSLTSIDFVYAGSYPDAVALQVFWFRGGEEHRYSHEYHRVRHTLDLPLAFSSFEEQTGRGTRHTFSLKTLPGVEAVAAVFDKALDAFAPNRWGTVSLRQFTVSPAPVSAQVGFVGESRGYGRMYKTMAVRSAGAVMPEAAMNLVEDTVEEELSAAADDADSGAGADAVPVREKFEAALTFQPFLRSDADGNLSFSFETSDKLSTYHVQVFAHDRDMHNALVQRDFVVTVPVQVSVAAPRFLYVGDEYRLTAAVSSHADRSLSGHLYCYVYPGRQRAGVEPIHVQRIALTVPSGGEESAAFPVRVPVGVDSLGFKVAFVSADVSDGVFVSVPVHEAAQTLTETHSAVLLPGMSRDSLGTVLQRRFINVQGRSADASEVSLADLVRAAVPDKAAPAGKDVLALSEAYYVRLLSARLAGADGGPAIPDGTPAGADGTDGAADPLLAQVLACRNGDGGFGWFEGMRSSPVITAVLLERFARLRDRGFDVPDLTASVRYLDARCFSEERPLWCGWISYPQYLYVRSFYPSVPFAVTATGDKQEFDKQMAGFRRYVKDYLVPKAKDGRGLDGRILDKARRITTLRHLSASADGIALAKAWGIRLAAAAKMDKSLRADVASLLEYAVAHPDGGWYYPNAVQPYRGLLGSEAYAHALLCDLLSASDGGAEVADGIRLWLMLQKESQRWETDPAYVDAITAVLDGSEAVLGTKVLTFSATYTKPFSGILAAGNGFTVERTFYRSVTTRDDATGRDRSVLREIRSGEILHRGDRIVAQYRVWSQENRSFVKLTAPREAALMPVYQLSGPYGWWLAPLSAGAYTFSPQGYRNVKADRTEYFFDTYPEESTVVSEEFFVTQDGVFAAPAVTIESLYAPHYRANTASPARLTVQ